MITMGENTRVEDLTLTLTGNNANTNLVGIEFPGNTNVTAKLRTSVVSVNNAGVSTSAITNVYGVLASGNGTLGPASFSFNSLKGSTINV